MSKNISGQYENLHLNKLLFDPQNPRFSALNDADSEDLSRSEFVIEKMIAKQNISDLVISIGDQGYFDGEPLLVFKDPANDDKYIVAEGNRRLAALNILNNKFPELLKGGLRETVEHAKYKPEIIPCIIFSNRSQILHYLGYKHITGVKSWGALEKAIYLEQLKADLKLQFPSETDEQLHQKLAREIGSQTPAIAKSLTALNIYNKGFSENNNKFFGLQRVSKDEVEFSLIYTALGYKNIYEFIGLESSSDVSLTNINYQNSKELFNWMFADTDEGERLVKESRQLSKLSHVVNSETALHNFRSHKNLELAFILSSGPDAAFQKNIESIEKAIKQLNSFLENNLEIRQSYINKIDNLVELIEDTHVIYKRRLKKQSQELED